MPPLSDFAPVIVAALMTACALIILWFSVRQAHSGDRKAAKMSREAERTGRDA